MNACTGFAIAPITAILLAGCSATPAPAPDPEVHIFVISTEPELVSGGDVRIAIGTPNETLDGLSFWLNDKPITPPMKKNGHLLEGVVTGLAIGRNVLEVRHQAGGKQQLADSVDLTNHPVTGPVFSGPQEQPFSCRTQESGLGAPLVDNHEGIGQAVYDPGGGQLVGYSRNCSVATRCQYFYYTGSGFKPFDPATGFASPPPDLRTTTLNGASVPFVVRVEVGTINRFLYTIAMLAPSVEPGNPAWNGKLVYWMRGEPELSHEQGRAMWFNNGLNEMERQLMPAILARGYAVVNSSGTQAGVHDLPVAEETALMTKEHFIEAYGKPSYTIGLGGPDGSASPEYLFAQRR